MRDRVREVLVYGVVMLTLSNSLAQEQKGITYFSRNGFPKYYIEYVEQRGNAICVKGKFFTRLYGSSKQDPAIEIGIDMNGDGILDTSDEFMLFRLGIEDLENDEHIFREISCAPYSLVFIPIESRHLGKNVKVTYWGNITVNRDDPLFESSFEYRNERGHKISAAEYMRLGRMGCYVKKKTIPGPNQYRERLTGVKRGLEYSVNAGDELAYVYGVPYAGDAHTPYVWFELNPPDVPKAVPQQRERMR